MTEHDRAPSEALRYRIERAAAVATVVFEHPRTRNALDLHTRAQLVEDLVALDADEAFRVIVLTGTDPAFSSGVDAKQIVSDPDMPRLPTDPASCLRALRTPTIAAVNGPCVSGALELALGCSFIIASERAVFADTHARLGLSPGWGMSSDLPAAVGIARARQMTLTALPVDAQTALQWGLVNEVVPHTALRARVAELARAISALREVDAAHALALYRSRQEAILAEPRRRERVELDAWALDLASAGDAFRRSVGPSTVTGEAPSAG